MESVQPLDEHGTFEWECDAEADVLYLSQDEPREAIGVEKLVGVTIVGVRAQLAKA